MKVLRHYLQTLGLILMVIVLSYGRADWAMPYVLPVTIIGVVGILMYAIITCKRRGWMMVAVTLMGGLVTVQPADAAYKIVDCGGQHTGKSTVEMLLEGSVAQGTVQAMQDAVMGGNVFTSEFESQKVEACVITNCINAAAEMCNPSGDTYDATIRANAFYVVSNVKRMSLDHATDNADGAGWGNDWIGDYMQNGTAEQRAAYERASRSNLKDASSAMDCAEDYLEHCAEIDKKNEADCRTIAQNVVQNVKNCWVCSIVDSFLMSVQRVAGYAYMALKVFSIQLLGVIFLFWIAAKVLRLIAGMGYDDHGGFLTEFLIRCITVMIAAAILHTPIVNFYSIAVSPFIQMTGALSTHITESALQDASGRSFYEIVNAEMGSPMVSTNPKHNCLQHCKNMVDDKFNYSSEQIALMGGKDNVVLDAASYSGLMCLTCRAYNQVTPFTAMGESFSCYSVKHGSNILSWLGLPFGTIPKLGYFLIGLMLSLSFAFVTLYLAFYIIDIVLKLGFVVVLTPLLIVAWAFPISRDYATRGWNMLVYCLAEFIGVAIMMALYMVIFMNLFKAVPGAGGSVETQMIALMKADDVESLYTMFGNGFVFPLKLIVVTFMATKMLQGVGQMVSFLTGVSPGIPSVAMAVLGGMMKQGMELAGLGTGAIGKQAMGAAKKLGSKMSGVFKRRNSNGGRMNKDGGPTNTSQRAAAGARSFSDKSRQAGTSVSKAGTALESQGQSLADKGRDMRAAGQKLAAKGGLKNRLKGAAMQAKGAMQTVSGMATKGLGRAVNPMAKAVGGAMNKAGTAVAGLSDKAAGKLQNFGDRRQREKEASLRADPKAAAQRERGYDKMAEGAQKMANGNIAAGLGMMIQGGVSVAASKARRMNNHHRRNAKRLNRGRPVNYRRSV